MTLQELVRKLDQLKHGLTIYAVYPWQPSSNAVVTRPQDDRRVPDEAIAAGCRYFLEVHVALHLLSQLARDRRLSDAEQCAALIEYAEFISSAVKPYPFLKYKFPVSMMIYCRGCAKLFDIVITGEGSRDYRCPDCGRVQIFDLDAFTRKAIEQSRRLHQTPRGSR